MRALTVIPLQAGSAAVTDMPEPEPGPGDLLVDGIALGVCGTDREIIGGEYGWAPPGSERLVLGHESLGRVREAPAGSGFEAGDLVVGVVRRPDPEPCPACAHGEFDFCRNGRYTERGIKQLHGYGSERWTVEADYAVKLDPALEPVGMLMEPASILAKAWDQIERIGRRAHFEPERVLVTGAGPIGLLAALLGVQRGLEVHVLDRNTDGPKPELVRALGAYYHHTDVATVAEAAPPDIIVEATGAEPLVADAIAHNAAFGIVCLTGVSPRGRPFTVDLGGLNRDIVLENDVVFGTVNANLGHYALAADALARADRSWLERMITRRVPLEDFEQALEKRPDDVKVVLDLDTIAGVWPGEVIEERAADIAEAADVLLRHQAAWRHRRVETITVLTHEQVRRHVSIDFTVPEAQREGLRLSAEEFVVPLALLSKRPLVHFDLRNEEQHAISLLTAEQHRTIGRELLYRQLEDEGVEGADELIEAVLADEPQDVEHLIRALEEAHGIALVDFRATAVVLSQYFIAWAIVRGLDRRRVFKFAADEPVRRSQFVYLIRASGCTEAESYHVEVVVPADLKARSTVLVDRATGQPLATGERDTDRPAVYYRGQAPLPAAPELFIDFVAERWRFLAPAALVAAIIALLVAPPFLFSDLRALPDTAGAAVGLVLSTSAVFSVLVLRTDEHPLVRLMLVRARALLAASTVAALFAAASIGFRTAGWIIEGTWALAALVSVLTAGILIIEAIRAPR